MIIMENSKKAYLAEYRKRTRNAATYKYEKTVPGFLMRKYRNMLSRVNGVQKSKHHLYSGKHLLSKDEFYAWSKVSGEFFTLFDAWEISGYDRKLCPTVDRIDSSKGYFVENMRWITHSENSSLGTISKKNKRLQGNEARPI